MLAWAVIASTLLAGAALSVSALMEPDDAPPPDAAPSTSAVDPIAGAPTTDPSTTTTDDPTTTTLPDGPVTVVGESLTLSAAPELEVRLDEVTVDAEVGRSFANDLLALERLAQQDAMGPVVVVHVGNNDPVPEDGFERILDLVGGRRLIVMTVSHPREWESQVNDLIESFALDHPEVEVVDWKRETEVDPDVLVEDRVHLSEEGIVRYAELVAEAVRTP